jgi:SprT-like family
VLQALKSLFGAGVVPGGAPGVDGNGVIPSGARSAKSRNLHLTQLELALDRTQPRTADELLARLRSLGLRSIESLRLTHNRNVMVSYKGSQLRVHEGYLSASEPVLRAIITFVQGRTRRDRKAAQLVIMSHPIVVAPRPEPRRERTHPDDDVIASKLMEWHERFNAEHFDGALTPIRVRVSRRMKSRLGHYSPQLPGGEPPEIAISRRHLRRHGWQEALHTLLHEMVHQWQAESSQEIDHGRIFRAKARQVGITPFARRVVPSSRTGALG